MKKIILLLIVLTMINCHNDEITLVVENLKIEDQPLDIQIEYTYSNLLEIGKILSKYSTSEKFKVELFSRLNSKNDNEESIILISDLISVNKKLNIFNADDENSLNKAIDAFKNIEGVDWKPQIFFPNSYKTKQRLTSREIDPEKPLIIPYAVEEPDDTYIAYQEDENGNLSPLDNEVDESVMEEYDVWVISLNESDNQVDIDNSDDNYNSSPYDISEYSIDKMIVKKHYESWVAGKSEVSIRGYKFFPDGNCHNWGNPALQCRVGGYHASNYMGDLIRKFSRSEVNNQTEITVNYIYERIQTWNYSVIPHISCAVIFESDAWPTPKRTKQFPLNDYYGSVSTKTLSYRSSHQAYSGTPLYGVIMDNENEIRINNYSENDSDMKYNLYLSQIIPYN